MAQDHWEELVSAVADQLPDPDESDRLVASSISGKDVRPHVYDYNAGTWMLVDTGASSTIVPNSHCSHDPPLDRKNVLQAVNGQTIPTYGKAMFKLNGESNNPRLGFYTTT